MSWKFDEKSPIYVQIAQHIKMQIISQEIKNGDQLPTVREVAEAELESFVNNMQKMGFQINDITSVLESYIKEKN